ncbi:MAG TPA: hypothetical protein G4N94_03310 [Caldilineae bacterium]|nr:hypothetical protein [Caldilineae bacterium]
MLATYKAVLKNNRLEWSGGAPILPSPREAVSVHVTILNDQIVAPKEIAQGKRMAAALEKLAAVQSLTEIADPVAWQREIRRDRALPDRDE